MAFFWQFSDQKSEQKGTLEIYSSVCDNLIHYNLNYQRYSILDQTITYLEKKIDFLSDLLCKNQFKMHYGFTCKI